MDKPSPSMRDLARRLLTASQTASDPHVHGAVLVSAKLRIALTKFAGAEGFASLLRRALALSSAEVPSLRSATVSADGRLEKLEQVANHVGSVGREEAVAVTAHLLGLLVTFIGEPLTLKLVREAWRETSPEELDSRTEVIDEHQREKSEKRSRQRSSDHSATAHRRAGPG